MLAPARVGSPRGPRNHDDTIIPDAVDVMCHSYRNYVTHNTKAYRAYSHLRHATGPNVIPLPFLPAEQLADEVQRRGIKTVVNLGSQAGIDEPVCRELGVNYVECPVGDVWWLCGQRAPGQKVTPAQPYDLSPLWKLIDDPASRPVLIHCQGGVHRTGVVTATAQTVPGSWWTDYAKWLADRSGGQRNRREKVGAKDYLPLDQAPGR